MMTALSVNINKIATLRNARGGTVPHVEQLALCCEQWGADGITVHPRPDERHIRREDVVALAQVLSVEFNVEGYPNARYMDLMAQVRPTQATLVPDPPEALTSTDGWDVVAAKDFLQVTILALKALGIRVSLFVAPIQAQIAAAASVGADRVELYTGAYATGCTQERISAVLPYVEAARTAKTLGLGVNAGHDLNADNLSFFWSLCPMWRRCLSDMPSLLTPFYMAWKIPFSGISAL